MHLMQLPGVRGQASHRNRLTPILDFRTVNGGGAVVVRLLNGNGRAKRKRGRRPGPCRIFPLCLRRQAVMDIGRLRQPVDVGLGRRSRRRSSPAATPDPNRYRSAGSRYRHWPRRGRPNRRTSPRSCRSRMARSPPAAAALHHCRPCSLAGEPIEEHVPPGILPSPDISRNQRKSHRVSRRASLASASGWARGLMVRL